MRQCCCDIYLLQTVPAGRWGRGGKKAASTWRPRWPGRARTCCRTSSSPCRRARTPWPPATAKGRRGGGPGWPRQWGRGIAIPNRQGTVGS
uniref:Uncharacterized protein n=1 Tax=Arundo donax TaxID=35708 RepID=A0A0A9BLF3_ARUDO